jgi:hypothetical protein
MTAHTSWLRGEAVCTFPDCKQESFLICRRCGKGICVFHLVKCEECPDYFCTACIAAHGSQHTDPAALIKTTAAPAALTGGQAPDLYVHFKPPVIVPGRGHVEVEIHGETAIVRVVDRAGETVECWPNAALVRSSGELLVLLGGHAC